MKFLRIEAFGPDRAVLIYLFTYGHMRRGDHKTKLEYNVGQENAR